MSNMVLLMGWYQRLPASPGPRSDTKGIYDEDAINAAYEQLMNRIEKQGYEYAIVDAIPLEDFIKDPRAYAQDIRNRSESLWLEDHAIPNFTPQCGEELSPEVI